MSRSSMSRILGSAIVLSTVAISLLVAPASAAGKTRWVDDDGKAGASSCSGTKTAYSAGIKLDGTGSGTSVRFNTIARFASDIRVKQANGGTIRNNTLSGGQVSLSVGDGDALSIHDNDFRSNSNGGLPDCKGESTAVVNSNGNGFDDNKGNTSDPAAMCDRGDVPH